MNKKKVIIDTNIIYSITGISPNTKISEQFSDKYECYITSAALIEVIVKYRNNLSNLQLIFRTLVNKKIDIINLSFAPVSREDIDDILKAQSISEVQLIIDKIFKLKILIESEFFRWVFTIVTIGIFEVQIKKENDLNNEQKINLYKQISALYRGNEADTLSYMQKEIKEGYLAGKPEQYALKAFEEKFFQYGYLYESFKQAIKLNINIFSPDFNTKNNHFNEFKKNRSKSGFLKKIYGNVGNLIGMLSQKQYFDTFDEFLSEFQSYFNGSICPEAFQYLILKIEHGFKNKSKFKKNDIFDFIQMFSYDLDGYLFITLDKKLKDLLKIIDPKSWSLIESL